MHLLLAEDDGTLSNLFKAQLRRMEIHTVTAVATKQEVLEAVEREAFDLMFIDMALEGIPRRGLEILKSVKKRDPQQRIGILSSNDASDIIRACRALGAEFYMVKPFTYQGLTLVLSGDHRDIQQYRPDLSEGQILSFVD